MKENNIDLELACSWGEAEPLALRLCFTEIGLQIIVKNFKGHKNYNFSFFENIGGDLRQFVWENPDQEDPTAEMEFRLSE